MSNSTKSTPGNKAQGPATATAAADTSPAANPAATATGSMELDATVAERDALKSRLDEVAGELDRAHIANAHLQNAFDAAKLELGARDNELETLRIAIRDAAGAAAGAALADFDAAKADMPAPTTWQRATALNEAEAKLAKKLGIAPDAVFSINVASGVIVTADGHKHSRALAAAKEGDA